jgi:nicotinamidase-related amidase
MGAQHTPYVPLSSDNAVLVLVDHQVGLLTGVRDIPVAELKNNVVAFAKAMQILKVPIIATTTGRDSIGAHLSGARAGAPWNRHHRSRIGQCLGRPESE